jgi:hypothetical protein
MLEIGQPRWLPFVAAPGSGSRVDNEDLSYMAKAVCALKLCCDPVHNLCKISVFGYHYLHIVKEKCFHCWATACVVGLAGQPEIQKSRGMQEDQKICYLFDYLRWEVDMSFVGHLNKSRKSETPGGHYLMLLAPVRQEGRSKFSAVSHIP